jgi:hypothetical protein
MKLKPHERNFFVDSSILSSSEHKLFEVDQTASTAAGGCPRLAFRSM